MRMDAMLGFVDRYCADPVRKNALDAGCGPGVFLKKLVERGFTATGIDMSDEMLKLAEGRLKGAGACSLKKGDIENLPFQDDSFDLVSSAGVIEYLNSDDGALRELKRVLRRDGMLLISVTNKYSYNLLADNLLNYVRRNRLLFRISDGINRRVLGRGKLKQQDFIIRKHSPGFFEEKLKAFGFQVVDSSFFYFLPLPHPLELLVPGAGKIGAKMEGLAKTKMRFMGEGYLLICRNVK